MLIGIGESATVGISYSVGQLQRASATCVLIGIGEAATVGNWGSATVGISYEYVYGYLGISYDGDQLQWASATRVIMGIWGSAAVGISYMCLMGIWKAATLGIKGDFVERGGVMSHHIYM